MTVIDLEAAIREDVTREVLDQIFAAVSAEINRHQPQYVSERFAGKVLTTSWLWIRCGCGKDVEQGVFFQHVASSVQRIRDQFA